MTNQALRTRAAAELISLSIREDRTVTEYPDTNAEAISLLEDLGVECDDDCCPQKHHGGAGYSGPEAKGYYDIWGTTEDGEEWRVKIVFGEVSLLGLAVTSEAPTYDELYSDDWDHPGTTPVS